MVQQQWNEGRHGIILSLFKGKPEVIPGRKAAGPPPVSNLQGRIAGLPDFNLGLLPCLLE